jgi:hypothetical protein
MNKWLVVTLVSFTLDAGIVGCTVVNVTSDGGAPGSSGSSSSGLAGSSGSGPSSGAGGSPITGTSGGGGGQGGQSMQDGGQGGGSGASIGSVVRTLVYHQVTTETMGVDTSKGVAFSRDGNHAVFVVSGANYDVTVVNGDGSGRRIVESVSANWIRGLAISDDGSLVAYQGAGGPLRVAATDGSAPKTVLDVTIDALSPRFAKDPQNPQLWRLYFVLSQDVTAPQALLRGVYSMKPDGTDIRPLLSQAEVATLANVAATVPWSLGDGNFDVSMDGTKFVAGWATGACTQTGERDFVIAGTSDGAPKRLLIGPLTAGCGLSRLAIAGNGSSVAYDAFADSSVKEFGVIGFDGSGKRKLGNMTSDNNWGLSDDGSHLLADYTLHNTDGSGGYDVAIVGGFASNDPVSTVDCAFGGLSGRGDRLLYVVAGASARYIGSLDINPTSFGSAPSVTQPTITPATITRGGASATVTAKVSSIGTLLRVGSAVLLNGHKDVESNCIRGEAIMSDDGTNGDGTATDGVFTNNQIGASSCATATGPRTVRVRAEARAADGKQHATVVEFRNFDIQ